MGYISVTHVPKHVSLFVTAVDQPSICMIDREYKFMSCDKWIYQWKSYLYCVGCEAAPQWEDALVSHNLSETVYRSTEMDVYSTKMGKTGTLRLRRDWKWKRTTVNQQNVWLCLYMNKQKGQTTQDGNFEEVFWYKTQWREGDTAAPFRDQQGCYYLRCVSELLI